MKITLTAACRTYTTTVNTRRKVLTHIVVKTNRGEVVASRTIPGKWNSQQALTEFRRFPERFTAEGWTRDQLVAVAKVA